MLERQENSYTWEEVQEGDLEISSPGSTPPTLPSLSGSELSFLGSPGMNIHEPSYCKHFKLPGKVHAILEVDWARWVQMRHESHLPPALKTVLEMWRHRAPSPHGLRTLPPAGGSPVADFGCRSWSCRAQHRAWGPTPQTRDLNKQLATAQSTLHPLRSHPTDSSPLPPPSGHLAAFGSWNTASLSLCPLPGLPLAPSHLCIPLRGAPHSVTAPPGADIHCFLTLPTDSTISESRSHI